MGAEEASTDEKTVKKTVKKTVVLPPRLAVTAQNSNFLIQFLNCELLFALLTSNITYEASVKYGRRGGFHRRENSEKQ